MPDSQKITGTLRGKLLITFGLLLIISLVFWVINKRAFRDINTVVSELALPNEKQVLLGNLYEGLSELIAGQRRETLNNSPKPSDWYITRSDQIRGFIDSLTQLFRHEPVQLRRMHFIDSIFDRQSTVYQLYLKNRYYFLKADLRKEQLDSLDKDIQANKIVLDSSVTSWENTTKTYTLLPPIKLPENTDTKNKRRQSRRNNREPDSDTSSGLRIMVEKTSNIHTDTLEIHPQKDSLMRRIEHSFTSVESLRQQKLDYLRLQEKQLLNNNQQLLSQLIEAIEKVRLDEASSAQFNARQSISIAEDTIALTERLTFAFLFIAGTLLLLIVWDISRMNSYRRQLEISKAETEYHSTAKQRFLSNMSHEIRTPLQSIIGFAELLRYELPPENKHIQPLLRSSEHLLQVVNEILDYSRVISGKLTIRPVAFNLKQTLIELSETAAWDCSRKSLEWEYSETPSIFPNCTVLGDELRLRQLLFNLIGNAVKYTPSGTIGLTVRSEFEKGKLHAHFEVSDTGEGIPANKLRTIFEAFEQNESHYTKGTGLGLSIVKELVDSMNGSIEVQSTVGEGSVFTAHLTFPLAEVVIPSEEEHFSGFLTVEGPVWVVDDDVLIRSLCARILEQQGISYRCFDTAEAVLAHPWDESLQLILCDFRLPGMDGGQLCQKLKAHHPEIPVIALTAQVLPEERSVVLAQGFDEVLLKPFKKREFLATIARFTVDKTADFDWKILSQMIDDPDERTAIIAEFCNECRADIGELKQALEKGHTEESLLLVHRLAGRTEQMGGKRLGLLFRTAEKEGRAGQSLLQIQEQVQHAVQALEEALDRL